MLTSSAPDLITLDLLDSVAELGSLGQAAARHRMSQPAVSMRMRQLERKLGLTLVRRTASGTTLTPAGQRIVDLSRRVLSDMRVLMAGAEALAAEQESHLRVAASLTVAEYLLPGWLAGLHRESPEVMLAVEVTNSAKVLTRVRDGLVDVGFVEGHEPELPEMGSVAVRTDRLVVVVDPAHPWAARRSPVQGEELAAADVIIREAGSGTREILEDALRSFGGLRSRLEMGSTAAILGAARRGDGPAVLSALAVADDLDAGRLVAVTTGPGVELSRKLRAVWPSDRPLAPLAGRLVNAASCNRSLHRPRALVFDLHGPRITPGRDSVLPVGGSAGPGQRGRGRTIAACGRAQVRTSSRVRARPLSLISQLPQAAGFRGTRISSDGCGSRTWRR